MKGGQTYEHRNAVGEVTLMFNARSRTHTTGKRGSGNRLRWGGKVRISHDPDHNYEAEFGGFHSNHSIFMYHGTNAKGFGWWNTSWVDRWLHKQVGRPWDDVWSEICSAFDSRTDRGHYIRNGIARSEWRPDVDTRTFVDDVGNIRTYREYRDDAPGWVEYVVNREWDWRTRSYKEIKDRYYVPYAHPLAEGFYVHPVTGLLCYAERQDWWGRYGIVKESAPQLRSMKLEDGGRYEEIKVRNGEVHWFYTKHEEIPYEHTEVLKNPEMKALDLRTKPRNWPDYSKVETDDEVLTSAGYHQEERKGEMVWVRTTTGTRKKDIQRSCNRAELAIIRKHFGI